MDFGIGIENGEEGSGENDGVAAANGDKNGVVGGSQTQKEPREQRRDCNL